MPQNKTSRQTPEQSKNTGDPFTAAEFNEVNSVVNNNADDINTRVGDLEPQPAVIDSGLLTIEGSSTPIQSYPSHDLPSTADTGTIAFNTSTGELIYFKNGKWNRLKDNNEIIIVGGLSFLIDTRNTQDPVAGKFSPSASDQFELPFVLGGAYDCTIDWDCNNPGTDTQTFNTVTGGDTAGPIVHTYPAEGEYLISISGVIECFKFDNPANNDGVRDSLKLVNFQRFGTLEVYGGNVDTSASRMFMRCRNAVFSAPDLPVTANNTDFLWMFWECYSLTTENIPLLDINKGNRFWAMFRDCTSITGLPDFDFVDIDPNVIANPNKFPEFVRGCTNLTNLDNVTFGDMSNSVSLMFRDCPNLTNVPPSCDFTNTTNFSHFLRGCSSITDFSQYNQLLNGTNFGSAWLGCALTAQAIENILGALVTNGRSNLNTDFSGGTNAAKSTWSATANGYYDTLVNTRGWVINHNA